MIHFFGAVLGTGIVGSDSGSRWACCNLKVGSLFALSELIAYSKWAHYGLEKADSILVKSGALVEQILSGR